MKNKWAEKNYKKYLEYQKKYHSDHKLESCLYYRQNKKKIRSYYSQWLKKNKDKVKVLQRKWYLNNKKRLNQKSKRYFIQNKDKCQLKHKSYYEKFPDRKKAHLKTRNAIVKGLLIRPKACSTIGCTSKGRIDAHHEDYSKPLEVRWLCTFHH
jgi:hypothetical protein